MKIVHDARLFVQTLYNDQYLFEYAIAQEQCKRNTFWGVGDNYDRYINRSFVKHSFIVIYPLLFILLLLLRSFETTFRILFRRRRSLEEREYFIAATNFSKSINDRINKHIPNVCWILNENVAADNYNIAGNRYVESYNLLSLRDVVSSAISSFVAYVLICRKFGTFYMLCSLNAYRWLLFWHACQNISFESSIYFINQKDRWAYLEDHILCEQKTLIQHGSEVLNCSKEKVELCGLLTLKEGGSTQCLPYRYRTLTRVITLSSNEIAALMQSIVDCTPEFIVGGYNFETYPLGTDKYTVLIIAYSGIYLDTESKIIEGCQNLSIELYVKNHPTQSNDYYYKLLDKYKFHFLTEQKFPQVDLVVTYDSTLAHEYKSIGIEVLYHTELSVENIIDIIKGRV